MSKVDPNNAGGALRGNYAEILKQIEAGGFCPFCREHFTKHHTEPILFTNTHWLATRNFKPYVGARHHFLLISHTHIERIEEMSAGSEHDFFEAYRFLCKEFQLEGASIVWRSGKTNITGATVAHLHAQVVVGNERNERSELIRPAIGFYDAPSDSK